MRNIHFDAVYHMPWLEYRHATPEGKVVLRLQTGRGDFSRIIAKVTSNYNYPDYFANAMQVEMQVAYRDEFHDWYECVFTPEDVRVKYLFILE
ncbi:MAG: alpha amylase N-terminal ig-like domain-containing protein, partial [Clostridia bacterium]|nr:alpha amylase N-terminal ig-like domain-containing protein [Clostridia bacterium]